MAIEEPTVVAGEERLRELVRQKVRLEIEQQDLRRSRIFTGRAEALERLEALIAWLSHQISRVAP